MVQESKYRKFGQYEGPEGPKESIWGGSPVNGGEEGNSVISLVEELPTGYQN